MTDPRPDTLPNVTCPVCKAPPGQVCVALDHRPFPQGHSERHESTPLADAIEAWVRVPVTDMQDRRDLLGSQARAFSASDPLHTMAEGEVVGIADFPTYVIRTADGTLVHWACHLTEATTGG